MIILDSPVRLTSLRHFLTQEECEYLVRLIDADLRPSEITTAAVEPDRYFRTSMSGDLSVSDAVVRHLRERVTAITGTQEEDLEGSQGQVYEVGQEFKPHNDWFASDDLHKFGSQRAWTFMVYLNELEEGGETDFPRLGLRIRPETGMAVVWYNLLESGEGDERVLHAGRPVKKGRKVIVTQWVRTQQQEVSNAHI